MYYIDVPYSINDAVSGVIEISGEVLIPGTYTFARNETLKDILTRAGGLSEVAYPLGAVFERESVKAQEENTNQILANQLESSVLTLAQSDIEGVGDQINAVLGFANQLRNQKVTGRMALNVLDSNISTPLYLQDGDKLTIPKRPSHVSIVGSVQKTTMASYKKDNTYKDYLRSAGGSTKVADMRQAYLLLPNGESSPVNSSTIIPAGAVLVIPPKIDKISVLGLTTIISRVMGNIATSILAINNVK